MVRVNKQMAAVLALGLAISAAATPSFAQRSDEGTTSSAREKSLRDCNVEAGKMSQYTWGDHQVQKYRSCMMQNGEQE
jgi:predicted outer membrane protein